VTKLIWQKAASLTCHSRWGGERIRAMLLLKSVEFDDDVAL